MTEEQKRHILIGFILIMLAIFIFINLDVIVPWLMPDTPVEQIETTLAYDRERNGINDLLKEYYQ